MRLIDAESLKDALEYGFEDDICNIKDLFRCIDQQPVTDAEPVVHAHWKELDGGLCYGCSNCPFVTDFRLSKYCPNCGAKMDEEV